MLNKYLSDSSDFLKGFAMIALVYVHYVRIEYGYIDPINWIWDPQVFDKIVTEAATYSWWSVILRYFAQVAVSIFFILSAWGIAYSLLLKNAAPAPLPAFMHARVRKLAPLYWIALFMMLVAALIENHDSLIKVIKILVSFGLKAAFLHTFHPHAMFNYNSALWFFGSLMFLYLLFPMLFRAMQARPYPTLLASLAIGYASTVAIKASVLYDWHPALAMGGFPIARLGDFAFGIFLAVNAQKCQQNGTVDPFERYAWVIGTAALAFGLAGYVYEWLHPFHAMGMGVFAVLVGAQIYRGLMRTPPVIRALVTAVAFVGVYSYSMFLFHMPLIRPWLEWVSDGEHIFLYGTLFLVVMFFLFYALEKVANRYVVPHIQRCIDAVYAKLFSRPRTH